MPFNSWNAKTVHIIVKPDIAFLEGILVSRLIRHKVDIAHLHVVIAGNKHGTSPPKLHMPACLVDCLHFDYLIILSLFLHIFPAIKLYTIFDTEITSHQSPSFSK